MVKSYSMVGPAWSAISKVLPGRHGAAISDHWLSTARSKVNWQLFAYLVLILGALPLGHILPDCGEK
jgi:hypothetical protein